MAEIVPPKIPVGTVIYADEDDDDSGSEEEVFEEESSDEGTIEEEEESSDEESSEEGPAFKPFVTVPKAAPVVVTATKAAPIVVTVPKTQAPVILARPKTVPVILAKPAPVGVPTRKVVVMDVTKAAQTKTAPVVLTVKAPTVPTLAPVAGITPGVPTTVVTTVKTGALTAQELTELLDKMPDIAISGVTKPAPAITADLSEYLKQESTESNTDFEARARLTHTLASIPGFQLNYITAAVAASMFMKKAKLGLSYDPDIEAALAYLMTLMKQ